MPFTKYKFSRVEYRLQASKVRKTKKKNLIQPSGSIVIKPKMGLQKEEYFETYIINKRVDEIRYRNINLIIEMTNLSN